MSSTSQPTHTKTFLLACGGTGGHLAPGIALAEALLARGHNATLLISSKKVDSRLSEKYPHLNFRRVPSAPLPRNPLLLPVFLLRQLHGFLFSINLVRKTKPDGIVGFGGFTTASVIIAGAIFRAPIALHESNRVPGRATRFLQPLAARLFLPPGIALPGVTRSRMRPMGLPVRKEIQREPRDAARASFGLSPERSVLVILGGSQGATSINNWARENLHILARDGIQVYCVTGLGKGGDEIITHPDANGRPVKSIFSPFCDRMAALMSAADLVVSRAGSGTIAELIRCVTPAILIPYPQAADNHQQANALYFEQQGGGVVIDQSRLNTLTREVRDTIFNDWLLRKFRENLVRMDRANSLDLLLDDLEQITNRRPPHTAQAGKSASPAA
ncbi:UDP-N-acetylglucosamine--N-acetylmuramyl-(pentapeptide) pyrophosphoryl-undecaprenol N-acetylglucosamine transferase [Ereboglobus sp. PH5-10]|uniref:UDP-N-acetylglucosamine--N-acetylmuramyl- (pentapeptide) pyrophosphoryl-undecaprenol N-acetylglucosamine transferase n=1 Tax=Ereboglobus sp. PH5-10 TaxID=2940629 RepID=UPI002404A4F9|nr:UDP-N-acetylglucosamine--N-acetylmuramyl-(pentapeptide) pyrophosphoryl-undecaprenol N-acetylglucosamine transferase [Ereboglobus sp. PH5-10]